MTSSVDLSLVGKTEALAKMMSTVEALAPVARVLHLFGLSPVQCSTIKFTPLQRVIKYYFLLLIAIRFSLYCYMYRKYELLETTKLSLFIDKFTLNAIHVLEMSILIEAFVKARQEKKFMEYCLEIDRILMHHFKIDLKSNDLRKSKIQLLIIWICIIVLFCGFNLLIFFDAPYFPHLIKWSISFCTTSLNYFQIIVWVDLIRYRLRIVNRLTSELKYSERCMPYVDRIDDTNECSNAIDDADILDQLGRLSDLYNRLWIQTNLLNERFKFTIVLNIGYSFTCLVAQLYFTCLDVKLSLSNGFLEIDIVSCIMHTFQLSMLCKASQSMANEALRIARTVHRIKFFTSSVKLSSFVCKYVVHFRTNCVNSWMFVRYFRSDNFHFNCFTKRCDSTPLSFLMSITLLSSR